MCSCSGQTSVTELKRLCFLSIVPKGEKGSRIVDAALNTKFREKKIEDSLIVFVHIHLMS